MPQQRTFSVSAVSRRVEDFEAVAEQSLPLKKHGRVELMVSSLAEKTRSDVPAGGSAWHEYTSYLSCFEKFFPHPKMQPFLDAGHVRKNRALLAAKVKVLRKHGYGASFSCHAPFFLPEEFFAKYPQLRGPRCDHPRRSTREAFSMCPDHPEAQQMYVEMAAEMGREIPELWWMRLGTNDAGAGLCWADWIYPGPNGPSRCRHIPTDARVKTLLDAIRQGLGADHPLDVTMDGNFSDAESSALEKMESELFHFRIHHGRNDLHQVNIGPLSDNPVRGIFDPVAALKALDATRHPSVTRIGLNFGLNYARGNENRDIVPIVVDLADSYFAEPAHGSIDRLLFLRKLCNKWVGEKKRDELLETLITLHEALVYKQIAAPRFTANYGGVSMRYITRPLVIVPELLTPDEEAYFLPHVFNPNLAEARTDYIDWHGGKLRGGPVESAELHADPRIKAVDQFCKRLHTVADSLATMGGTHEGDLFVRMAVSLRIYASVMRSFNNFFSAGTLRDRNINKLAGPAHIPPKIGDWVGDPDLQLLNGVMRDELDNSAELISLLENGGMSQVLVADCAEDEDTFLLGPNLVDQLRQKCAIMRRHWIDAESYMSTPHK